MRWHDALLDACKVDNSLSYVADQAGPTRGARAMAIVQAAVYDAVNSIDESYTPYLIDVNETTGASVDAAVARAARDTLAAMYPKQTATFDAKLEAELAAVTSGKAEGVAVGAEVAAAILADRADDGATAVNVYTPGTGPLDWKPDPLHPAQKALTPDWGFVTPFTMSSGSQFRPAPPPDATTAEYAAAFDEVRRLGGDGKTTPTERTEEQTEIGIYWGYDGQPGLCIPPRLYNQIAQQIARERGNTLVQNARLLALANLAMADAGVSGWEAKYFYNFARPVTAIREADADGNPDTPGVADWAPLGAPANNGSGTNFTPPFPAYVSGHAVFGAAVFQTLRRFYGTDDIPFTFLSDEYNGVTFDQMGLTRPVRPRHFDTLRQAEEENGQSRIYLGIHWQFDKVEGIRCGDAIADHAFDHFLRARPEKTRIVVGADEGGGPRVRVFGPSGQAVFDFFAFDPGFTGGVRVAQGDVTGDHVPDVIVAAGRGGTGQIKVFDGTDLTLLRVLTPFENAFTAGCYVAAADVDGDGRADIIASAAEGGGPRVRVFTHAGHRQDFFAFDPSFRGGARVAAGDADGDGRAEVTVTPGDGGGPLVRTFDGTTGGLLREFMAYAADFRGGVYVAVGDCDGDGKADVITGAGAGGSPHVAVFDALGRALRSYFAFDPDGHSGIRVGSTDRNGDGRSDILAATAGGRREAHVVCDSVSDGNTLGTLDPFEAEFLGGVFV